MSGDVQPRKRKDKKRKKEESIEDVIHQVTQPATSPNDEVNIHIHKDSSTGGGICAKFVFFILLAVLAVLIGLIITEHRGLTDLDAVSTESRFSEIFEGWTDESSLHDDHDDDEVDHSKELGSHEEEEDDDHEHDDEDHEHDDDDHEHEEDDDEHDDEDQETDEETRSVISEEEATNEETAERTEEDEEGEDTMEQDDDEEELGETIEHTEEDEAEEAEDQDENMYETAEDTTRSAEEGSLGTTETYEESEEVVYNDEIEEQGEDDEHQDDDSAEEIVKGSAEDEEDREEKQTSDEGTKADDDENAEQVYDNEEAPTNAGVVKFGVGVSLLVVAYVVLVRKWRTDNVSSTPKENEVTEELPDLSRRNTIVLPPTLDEIRHELDSEEDYTEEEDDGILNEEKFEESSKRQYQELRSVYTRTLTPDDEYDKSPAEDEYDNEQEDIDYEHERYADEEEDEEDDEDIEETENDEDDHDLLKRLEAKYGKIRHSDEEDDDKDNEDDEDDEEYDDYEKLKPWRRSDNNVAESDDEKTGAQSYHFDNITNEDDWPIREDLDNAQGYLPKSPVDALSLFNKILELYPHSPRALYGKAKCLDLLAESKQSNKILQESIDYYLKVVTFPSSPEALFRIAADRCIDRMRFIGQYGKAIFVHKLLVQKYPDVSEYPNQLAVTYLTINKVNEAKDLLYKTLLKWPNDGFALVHYGFILKTNDNNIKEAISYLQKGIDSKAPGVIDGRFYFHLGDALTRLGRESDAYKVYEDGVLKNVFLSKYQRSLYNVNRLRGKPWWKEDDLPLHHQKFFILLKDNWKVIRDEGLAALNRKNTFKNEAENLRDVGDWKQLELFARGVRYSQNCQKCPRTCKILDTFSDASTCRRGQIKFSVMEPGTHVWPHCGPTNCRLRLHLGLKVPPNTYIRVADKTKTWNEGHIFIFDDSFEHEVWHNGTDSRLVLIVDMWHPDLTLQEKSSLSAI